MLIWEDISTKADEFNATKEDWNLLSCAGYLQETASVAMSEMFIGIFMKVLREVVNLIISFLTCSQASRAPVLLYEKALPSQSDHSHRSSELLSAYSCPYLLQLPHLWTMKDSVMSAPEGQEQV